MRHIIEAGILQAMGTKLVAGRAPIAAKYWGSYCAKRFAVTAFGVILGLIGAVMLSRIMAGYVYGVSPTDPLTFSAASLLLAMVALLASYIPARRASRVDPVTALRYE